MDSETSNEDVEFTLIDALDHWNGVKENRQYEIEELVGRLQNNPVIAPQPNITTDELKLKQQTLLQSLRSRIRSEIPKDYPIPKTSDLDMSVLKRLEDEIISLKNLQDRLNKHIEELENNINQLENKKSTIEKMKQASLNAMEDITLNDYDLELRTAKSLFREIKNDLYTVVESVFPDNNEFHVMLQDLARAFTKGGDDMYISVTEENNIYAKFMIEADIGVYHPNDKNKLKLQTLI